MIGIANALPRAADLTRLYPESRTKRISISVEESRVTVAATDGAVGVLFTCSSPARFVWSEGLYSVRGCDLPRLYTGHWSVRAHGTSLVCTSVTSKGRETYATRQRSRVVELERGTEGAVSLEMIQSVTDVSTGFPDELAVESRGEIAAALAVLDAGAAVEAHACLESDNVWRLHMESGPFGFWSRLGGGPQRGMHFRVGALDTALELLEGFKDDGIVWRFPTDPRRPVVISSACGSIVVCVAPLLMPPEPLSRHDLSPVELPHGH